MHICKNKCINGYLTAVMDIAHKAVEVPPILAYMLYIVPHLEYTQPFDDVSLRDCCETVIILKYKSEVMVVDCKLHLN
jgi:hypothetical protein